MTKFEFTCDNDQFNLLMVRFFVALLSGLAVVGALSSSADDVLPPHFNFDRYRRMVDESPFAIATAAALPEATPDFARDLYVANAARSPEGDMVTLMSGADRNFKKYLTTREPVDGYTIASIEWSEDVGKTKVTISKDGKFATLTFNQAFLSQAASGGRLTTRQIPATVPVIHSPEADQTSRVHSRGVTQRNPKGAAAPTPNVLSSLPRDDLELPPPPKPYQQQAQEELQEMLLQKQKNEQTKQTLQRTADSLPP